MSPATTRRTRTATLLVMATVVLTLLTAPVASATEFPPGRTGYHSYTELTTEVAAVAAAHPDIVKLFSIGTSYQGRQLWAVKISDNVGVDEAEPEVMFDGTHHADEHMATEMTLHILHWLTDGYGVDPRITAIVNTREIWIVFLVNPDGAEYDISGGTFHSLAQEPAADARHDRRSGPTSTATTATAGAVAAPRPARTRGPSRTAARRPFSTPEDRAMRDFMASRVVNGRQQIRAAITFHEYGRLVMWPYGYTRTDVPSDMTTQDHAALAIIGKHMAATDGYKPEQASDLYVDSGTSRDYEYGTYRIFAYTIELSAVDYPDDSLIASETGRNKEAVLYLMERAWCPLSVLGPAVRTARCGAFDDDLEVARGWTVNPDGTDTAPASGRFVRANPAGTTSHGPKQLTTTRSGSKAFVTGAAAGSSSTANDLDGRTTIRSTAITLPATTGQRLTFAYVFAHSAASTSSDSLRAIVERADGSQVQVFRVSGKHADVDGAWRTASISMAAFAGTTVHLRFVATDGGPGNLVEVELDDIRVTRGS